ncbi:MAG: iron-containing alcohol dehydrogenase [Candidatus Sumerlaeota bacterium]|nr:iron-containing alcohol dehydrogenase [Candidatus Sumerlaeota bacterium]
MDNFTFHNPTKLVFGQGVYKQVGAEMAAAKCKKALLLAGGGSIRKNGVYRQIVASLKKARVKWIEVWGVRPNPVISKVREAIAVCRKEKVDSILAVGGGSVLDSAKAIAAGVYLKNVWDAFEGKAAIKKALPVFAALTLSATGSEMNAFAVVTNEAEKKKWHIGASVLFPKVSFLDPAAQMTLPWNQTVNGALDALAHIMEAYVVGTSEETPIALNEALSRSVIAAADALQKNPKDYAARANLAWAATLALNGISGAGLKGGDWATHTLEHAVSALHPEVAHGAGLGVLFPAFMLHLQKHNNAQFQRWAKAIWGSSTVEKGVAKMRAKIKQWGSATTLDELGLTPREIPALVANAMRSMPMGAVKPLTKNDIAAIYRLAFGS